MKIQFYLNFVSFLVGINSFLVGLNRSHCLKKRIGCFIYATGIVFVALGSLDEVLLGVGVL